MEKLDLFGKQLIEQVRDLSAEQYISIRDGKMKSVLTQELSDTFKDLDPQKMSEMDRLVANIIDRVIHNFLFLFEQSDDFTIAEKNDKKMERDIIPDSDGITGELYGEDGWFVKFSRDLLASNNLYS